MVQAMTALALPGRVLFLCDDAQRMHAQLAGQDLSLTQAQPLRDDVSTDEITPVAIMGHYDDTLGQFAHTGLRAGQALVIPRNALKSGGFSVLVAGKRYGKGSSREHSPTAEKLAGIRLVVAESFERIYRQNADNMGLLTSTDMGLPERIQRGEAITLDEILQGRDNLAASIVRSGGMLAFGQQHLRHTPPAQLEQNAARASSVTHTSQGHTLFEKIIARHLLHTNVTQGLPAAGQGAFVRADWRFIHEYYTGMAAHMLRTTLGPHYALHEPHSVVVFEDHTSYMDESPAHVSAGLVPLMLRMAQAQRSFVAQHGLRSHCTLTDAQAALNPNADAAGISHAMMAEHYALPGQVVVGTDSHTPHSGALGCVAFGVGTTDMANAFVTGAVRLTMPHSLRVHLHGPPAAGVTAKDVVLHLLARADIRAGVGVGKVFEFAGDAVAAMSIDERATLTNMTAELGGLTGIVAPDAHTVQFLQQRRNVHVTIEPWMHSDANAIYAHEITLDCRALSPMVAAPGDPGNGMALDALQVAVPIDIAYGGSCTAGKRADFDHYHAVLAWGLAHGLTVPAHVQLYLQYGTTAVRDYCIAQGYDITFRQAGACMLQPSCGACANCGPGSSTQATQVTVSAINRNFAGRSGPGQVWLASPPTVMASALAGRLMSFEQLQRTHREPA